MNNLENKKYFYDINRNGIEDILRVFIEEGTSEILTRRVNDSLPYSEKRINLDNWEYNKHAEAEKEATLNIFNLGKDGYNLVIWISPDDGGEIYKEGRLNIEFPVFGQEEWSLYGKHMPLFWDREEAVDLSKRLLMNGGISVKPIENSEDVRRQPIGFKVNNIDEWIKKCRELIPEFEEVWKFIENGGDLENQEKMRQDVMMAIKESRGDNYIFESLMARMGNGINSEGGHGSSYGGGEMGIIVTVNSDGSFSYREGSTKGLSFCEKCGCYYSGEKCPKCEKSTGLSLAA